MSVPPELLYALVTGVASGLVTGGSLLIGLKRDVRWLQSEFRQLRQDVNTAHRRIDQAIQPGGPS